MEMDKKDGDHLWEDAVKREMKNSQVAFQAHDSDIKDLIGHKQIACHLILMQSFQSASEGKHVLLQMAMRFQLPH